MSQPNPSDLQAQFLEHLRVTRERYDRLSASMREGWDNLRRLEDRVEDMEHTLEELERELGGAPKVAVRGNRRTIRSRMHTLENEAAAAKLSQQILQQVRERQGHAWTRAEKIGLFCFAGIAAAASIALLFVR